MYIFRATAQIEHICFRNVWNRRERIKEELPKNKSVRTVIIFITS